MTSLLRLPGCCTYSKSKCALILTAVEMQITQEPAFVQQQHHCSRLRELQCYRHTTVVWCAYSTASIFTMLTVLLMCMCTNRDVAWSDTGDSAAVLSHISFQTKMGFFLLLWGMGEDEITLWRVGFVCEQSSGY